MLSFSGKRARTASTHDPRRAASSSSQSLVAAHFAPVVIGRLKEARNSVADWPRGPASAADTSFRPTIKLLTAFQTLELGHAFSRFGTPV